MSGGPARSRRCVSCAGQPPDAAPVLLLRDPRGGLAVDLKGKLTGPGLFVCPDRDCLERLSVATLADALGTDELDARAVAALPQLVATALTARVKSLLGLAQRGGNLVSGAEGARAALRRAPARGWLTLVATDASAEVARRLCDAVQSRGVALARCLTTHELGDSIGKSPRSIVVIEDPGLARSAHEAIVQLTAVGGRDPGT